MVVVEKKVEKEGVEYEGEIMEIRLLEKNKEKLSFLIMGSNPAFVNDLRDTMITLVPTLAIEDIEFKKNDTVLYDEIIAHRLGLIPIKTDLKSYELSETCSCKGKGCAKCTLKLTLTSSSAGNVYTAKLKSKDPQCGPVSDAIPIAKMLKGQGLQLEATAIMGIGKEHAKWSPCLAYYKYKPGIKIVKDPKDATKVANSCPVNVFKVKENKLTIEKDNLLKCHLCEACVEASEGAVELEENYNDFVFYVESWGQLDPEEIVSEALDIMHKKFDEFEKTLK